MACYKTVMETDTIICNVLDIGCIVLCWTCMACYKTVRETDTIICNVLDIGCIVSMLHATKHREMCNGHCCIVHVGQWHVSHGNRHNNL